MKGKKKTRKKRVKGRNECERVGKCVKRSERMRIHPFVDENGKENEKRWSERKRERERWKKISEVHEYWRHLLENSWFLGKSRYFTRVLFFFFFFIFHIIFAAFFNVYEFIFSVFFFFIMHAYGGPIMYIVWYLWRDNALKVFSVV